MAQFDAAAATAAYLAQLSPAAHAKATAYTQGGHWLLLWGWLVTVAAALIILKSGVLTRAKAGLEAKKPRPLLVAFMLSLMFLVADFVLELPWTTYADWWREKAYGLNNQTWPAWLSENAMVSAIGAVAMAVFFMALYGLIRRSPRFWPVWAAGLTAAFLVFANWIQPVAIEPLLNSYKPAPPGAVRDMVVSMGKAVGVPTDKIYIYNGSKQSNRYTANVAGMFGTARVALSDTMFLQGADLSEVKAVVGHEMGHYVRRHIIWSVAIQSLLVILGGWLIQRLFPLAQRALGAGATAGLADPAALPVLLILAATLGLIATPITNTMTRMMEADADAFSLRHAREPDGLAKALVKTIEYRASSPSDLEEFLFYDHPSVEHRIRKAMDWKAAHMPGAPAAPAQ